MTNTCVWTRVLELAMYKNNREHPLKFLFVSNYIQVSHTPRAELMNLVIRLILALILDQSQTAMNNWSLLWSWSNSTSWANIHGDFLHFFLISVKNWSTSVDSSVCCALCHCLCFAENLSLFYIINVVLHRMLPPDFYTIVWLLLIFLI